MSRENLAPPTITKRCPDCGRELTIRTNRHNDNQFLACTGYPECRHTEPIPETLKLRLAGVPELPMFDDPAPAPKIEHCRSCGAPVIWGLTASGKSCPFDVVDDQAGDSHFKSCPDSRGWSKR